MVFFFWVFFFKRKRLDHKTKRQIFRFVGKKCLICPEIKFSTTNKPAPKCLSLVIATLSLQILFETTLLVLLFLRCYCVSCRPKCGEKTLNLKKKNLQLSLYITQIHCQRYYKNNLVFFPWTPILQWQCRSFGKNRFFSIER